MLNNLLSFLLPVLTLHLEHYLIVVFLLLTLLAIVFQDKLHLKTSGLRNNSLAATLMILSLLFLHTSLDQLALHQNGPDQQTTHSDHQCCMPQVASDTTPEVLLAQVEAPMLTLFPIHSASVPPITKVTTRSPPQL